MGVSPNCKLGSGKMQKVKQQVYLTTENYIQLIKFMQENKLNQTSIAINKLITQRFEMENRHANVLEKLQQGLIARDKQIKELESMIEELLKKQKENMENESK